MKKSTKNIILWIAIIIVVLIDLSGDLIGTIPIFGDITSATIDIIAEITEIGLVFGLIKNNKR